MAAEPQFKVQGLKFKNNTNYHEFPTNFSPADFADLADNTVALSYSLLTLNCSQASLSSPPFGGAGGGWSWRGLLLLRLTATMWQCDIFVFLISDDINLSVWRRCKSLCLSMMGVFRLGQQFPWWRSPSLPKGHFFLKKVRFPCPFFRNNLYFCASRGYYFLLFILTNQ